MKETILLIGRGNGFGGMVAEFLEGLGYFVINTANVGEAVVVSRSFKCHLVILDLDSLNGQEGSLVTQLFSCIDPMVPGVFVAGTPTDVERLIPTAEGRRRVQFLTKPVAMNALYKTVRIMLSPEARRLEV